jgi:hypothetical protein
VQVGVDRIAADAAGAGGCPPRVFLLDFTASDPPVASGMRELLLHVLVAPRLYKLVFGFHGDMKRLPLAVPGLAERSALPSVLDLQSCGMDTEALARALAQVAGGCALPEYRPAANAPRGAIPLARLVAAVLGAPLDKRQQTSNWDRRPLLPAQTRYAALDVRALLLIFRKLVR